MLLEFPAFDLQWLFVRLRWVNLLLEILSLVVKRYESCPDWPKEKEHDEADEGEAAEDDEHGVPAQVRHDRVVEDDPENRREAKSSEEECVNFHAEVRAVHLPSKRREYRLLSAFAGPGNADPDRVQDWILHNVRHAEG